MKAQSYKARIGRINTLSLGLMCVLCIALFAPVVLLMARTSADYHYHVAAAQSWAEGGEFVQPHFLYHLSLIILHWIIPGVSYGFNAFGLGIFLYIFTGMSLYSQVRPLLKALPVERAAIIGVAVPLIMMIVSPIHFLTLQAENLYLGYIGINVYHNPTMTILNPLAVWLFLYAVKAFTEEKHSFRIILIAGLVAVLSSLAKPHYAMCLLPALGLMTGYRLLVRRSIDWKLLVLGVGLPVSVVMFWQFFLYQSTDDPGLRFAPLQVMSLMSDQLLLKFVLSIAFPAGLYIAYFKAARQDTALNFAWLAFGFGAFYTYFFAETKYLGQGNFLWSGQVTLFILFFASILFFIRQWLAGNRGIKSYIVATILAVHVVSGVRWYLSQVDPYWNTWW